MSDRLEGVQVLHLGSRSEFRCPDLADREVDIGTHGTLLQFAIGCSEILNDQAKFLEVRNDLVRTSHIRLRNDLDQRDSASVIIDERAILPLIMDQLSGILLHVDLMNADFLFSASRLDLDPAIVTDRKIELGNLIVLRIIRVEIVLSVKLAILIDSTVRRKTNCKCILNNLLV